MSHIRIYIRHILIPKYFICHIYECVTDVLHMRTTVRIRNSYICVLVLHVEFNTCDNNTISSHLIKLRRKIDTVRLCRPDVSTDQDLHCLPFFLSDITLNGINKRQKDCIRYYKGNMTANLGLHCSHVTNAAFDVFFFCLFFPWATSNTRVCTLTTDFHYQNKR